MNLRFKQIFEYPEGIFMGESESAYYMFPLHGAMKKSKHKYLRRFMDSTGLDPSGKSNCSEGFSASIVDNDLVINVVYEWWKPQRDNIRRGYGTLRISLSKLISSLGKIR